MTEHSRLRDLIKLFFKDLQENIHFIFFFFFFFFFAM